MQQLNQQVGEVRQQVQTARQPVEELENQMHRNWKNSTKNCSRRNGVPFGSYGR
jgi:hypothetical protein